VNPAPDLRHTSVWVKTTGLKGQTDRIFLSASSTFE
jgi:hypothetical protein